MGKRKSKPGNAKIVFAILAHEDEALLASQIRNLRHFNDDAEIVLYNGGPNPKFGRGAGVPICPYSKPLKYEFLTEFRIDVARWLEEAGTKYEYLVNLDHDMLFVKRGFGSFLDEWMAGFDAMGYEPTISHHPMEYGIYSSKAVPAMWGEWKRWQPVFGLNLFVWMLNAGQVYRRGLVRSILSRIDRKTLYPTLRATKVTAAEEMVFPTLARACGANLRSYPPDELGVVSMEPLPWWKVELARVHPHAYWIHPAKGELGIRMAERLFEQERQAAAFHPQLDAAYRLVNRCTGKVLEICGESVWEGAAAIQWEENGRPHQRWMFERVSDHCYRLVNRHSGMVLDIQGQSVDAGAPAIQWPDNGGANQMWYLMPVEQGYFRLLNRHSLKVLDTGGANGERAIQSPPNDERHDQQWSIEPTA